MPTLLIAYDLSKRSPSEATLATAIMRLGTRWSRPLASIWYVETAASCASIEAQLTGFLGLDDGLMVQEVIGEAALANTMLRWTPSREYRDPVTEINIVAMPKRQPVPVHSNGAVAA